MAVPNLTVEQASPKPNGDPVVRLWPEAPPVPTDRLDAEVARLRSYLKEVGDA
ncbi:hypothetical protein OG799_25075 [Micromonospora sp. NBC_00898]|uniref:hypothetical protein n=1 Tax=Micromonospora sp. NBC_00898 TaxID=2975981 RepID=UPI00386CAB38|nr:hypothetical protein OG799_25075 [Micromonospora sp. NBC_00898]